MPRNGSGTYSLPTGNPVVTGTTIETSWANNTLSDVAAAMTDSLSRSGQGGMTAAFRAADGTSGLPGVAFTNETTTGFYRAGSADMRLSVTTTPVQQWLTSGTAITGTLSASGNVSFDGGSFTFNEAGADKDARFEGDTDANLLFTDASTDRVGVGTNAPATKLTVRGATQSKEVAVRWERSTDGSVAGGLGYFYDAENSVAVGAVSNHPVKLIVNDATVATLDTSGNLGVGTTAPAFGSGSGVEIQRAGVATLRLENSSASNSFELYADTAGNGVNLRGRDSSPMNFWTANTSRMTLDASGNLGVGTSSPAAKLEVVGSLGNVQVDPSGARVTFTRDDANYIRYGSTAGELIFEEGTTERFRIGSSGQLGIGGANYGTSGQVLASQGSGAAPQWVNAATGDVTLNGTQTLTNKTLSTGTALSATVTGNDSLLTRVMLQDTGWDYHDSGTTNALDYVNGSVQRWAPNTGSQTLTISNWPPSGAMGELLIQGVNLGAATITWPTINWIKSDGTTTTTFSANGVTLQTSGTDWVFIWTRDGGTTLFGKVVR